MHEYARCSETSFVILGLEFVYFTGARREVETLISGFQDVDVDEWMWMCMGAPGALIFLSIIIVACACIAAYA